MGSMSAENFRKAQYIAAAVERALRDIGLSAMCVELDAGHSIGVRIDLAGSNGPHRAGRFPLPSAVDSDGVSTVLPGWEPA
jgi:hypothetical protein